MAEAAFFVTGDIAGIKQVVAQEDGLKALKSDKWLAWVAPGQQALPDEPWSIWPERRCPMLWLGGEEGTWEKVGRDYLKQIDDRLLPDKSVAELGGYGVHYLLSYWIANYSSEPPAVREYHAVHAAKLLGGGVFCFECRR